MQRSKNASEPKGLTKANHAPTNFVFEPGTKTCGSEPGRSTTTAITASTIQNWLAST